MTESEIKKIREKQCEFFKSGATIDVDKRIEALEKLYFAISENEELLRDALHSDLGKSGFESDMCEIRLTLSEISYMIRKIRSFAKPKRVHTPLAQFHSKSFKQPSPYGTVLIMSPWNYPVLLTLEPLADAIAAGNTAMIKPSAYSPVTSKAIKAILSSIFKEEYVAVIEGGREENQCLLSQHFDYIFFTGSKSVGHEVMKRASEYLTPITLELGGKSPCIVDSSANLKLSARRIVFGKYLNLGQTCVAPDYLLVDRKVHSELLNEIKNEIKRQFGDNPLDSPDYGKIINRRHFDRINGLIDIDKVIVGGRSNEITLQIEPTVMNNVSLSDSVMQQEIFGPILPVIAYDSIEEVLKIISSLDHPLAFYVFSKDKKLSKRLIESVGFGGGCINDTIIHLATSEMGFGGFGESGMGSYHGKAGFEIFSHYKSIVDKKLWIDLPMRYRPYKKIYHKMIRFFLK